MRDDPNWFSDLPLHSLRHVFGGFGRSGPQDDGDDDDEEEEVRAAVEEQHLSSRIKKAISELAIRQSDRLVVYNYFWNYYELDFKLAIESKLAFAFL